VALAACGQGQLLVYCACSAPEFTRRAVAGRCGVLDETRRRRTIEQGFRTRNLERARGRAASVRLRVRARQASGVRRQSVTCVATDCISWQPGAASPKGRTKTWPRGKKGFGACR
jgi:hypothetical protein